MGKLFRFKNIHVLIWSNDHNPPHVEVFSPGIKGYEAKAKFTIADLECYESEGFSQKSLKRIKEELLSRHEEIKTAWKEIHNEQN